MNSVASYKLPPSVPMLEPPPPVDVPQMTPKVIPAGDPRSHDPRRILRSRVNAAFFRALTTLAHYMWQYTKDGAKVVKKALKAAILVHPPMKDKVNKVICCLGFLSAIKFVLQWKELVHLIHDLYKDIVLHDTSGIIWTSMDLAVLPLEILSTVLSLGESLYKFIDVPWPELFGYATMPLAPLLLSYHTVSSIASLVVLSMNLHTMPKTVDGESPAQYLDRLDNFFRKKLGVTDEEEKAIRERVLKEFSLADNKKPEAKPQLVRLKTEEKKGPDSKLPESLPPEVTRKIELRMQRIIKLKERQLARGTGRKIVNIMKNVQEHRRQHPDDTETAKMAMADMRIIVISKIAQKSIGISLSVVEGVMYVAALIFPIMLWVPFVFSLGKSCFPIAKRVYNDLVQAKLLNLPDFTKRDFVQAVPACA